MAAGSPPAPEMGHLPTTPAATPTPPAPAHAHAPQLDARNSISTQAAADAAAAVAAVAASSSSISAPVSPSASFASLEALRYSLAMRSGNLDLDQSAHTFPIQDDQGTSTSARSAAGPSAPTRSASSAAAPTRPPAFTSTSSASSSSSSSSSHRSANRNALRSVAEQASSSASRLNQRHFSAGTSSAYAVPSSSSPQPPPIPPPLSLGNLPCPRSYPSPYHERRISPFHEGRGMSFTPATTPPPSSPPMSTGLFDFEHEAPVAASSMATMLQPRSRRRRHRSGSASGSIGPSSSVRSHGSASLGSSRSSSPVHFRADSAAIPTRGAHDQHHLHQRTRSRASSDASGGAGSSRSTPSTRILPSASPESLRIQTLPSSTTRPPIPIPQHHQQRHQRRTSAAAGGLGRSLPHAHHTAGLGVDESEASDTGAEADRDDGPPRHVRYPNRTRSVTHLPSHTQLHLSANSPLSSDTGHSGDDTVRSPAQHRASIHSPPSTIRRPATSGPTPMAASSAVDPSSSPLAQFGASPIFGPMSDALGVNPGYFPLTSNPADFLPTPQQLWQLHQAALGISLGMGVGTHTQAEADHLNEFLAPPPPYQANDSNAEAVQAARDSVNRMEFEQAEASVGRSLHGGQVPSHSRSLDTRTDGNERDNADVITFRTRGSDARRRNSGYQGSDRSRDQRQRDSGDDHSTPSRASSLARRRAAGIPHSISRVHVPRSDDERPDDLSPASPSSPDIRSATSGGEDYDSEYPASPPAWLPKSDTELETDINDTEAERAESPNGFPAYASGRGSHRRTWASRAMSRSRSGGSSTRSFRRSTRMSTSSLVHHLAVLEEEEAGPSLWLLVWLLHPLRLLAAVPGTVGTYWLIRNARLHLDHSGSLLVRGPLDPSAPHISNPFRLTCGLDFILASLWALSTAYHALSLTTLLLRRWLVYYSLLPSLIRLIALQSICWPLVRLTIFVAGPDRPIEAWIIIASFTALSDVVARWVTSNIADAPSPPPKTRKRANHDRSSRRWQKRAQIKSEDEDEDGQALSGGTGNVNGAFDEPSPTAVGSGEAAQDLPNGDAQGPPLSHVDAAHGPNSDHDAGETAVGEDQEASARGGLGANPGQRFWRAVMGAPIDSSTSDSESDEVDEGLVNLPLGSIEGLEDLDEGALSLAEGLEDGEGEGGESSTAQQGEGDGDATTADEQRRLGAALARRRRRHRMRLKMAALSSGMGMGGLGGLGLSVSAGEGSSGSSRAAAASGATSAAEGTTPAQVQQDGGASTPLDGNATGAASGIEPRASNLRRRRDATGTSQPAPQSQQQHQQQQQQHTRSTAPARAPRFTSLEGIRPRVRIRSRRVFHWEVAMKRNVAPLGVLAYATLWGLLLGGVGRKEDGVALHAMSDA